jgi:hypothetical protein
MTREVFFSFHYDADYWRASQVRNMGVVEKNPLASDNAWEEITEGGDPAIEAWIDAEMKGRTCAIVLIGNGTANRKWINHEIVKAWNDGKGVIGIHIHGLKDKSGDQTPKGANPFDYLHFSGSGALLSTQIKAYDPPYTTSTYVYDFIRQNLSDWVETAIAARQS